MDSNHPMIAVDQKGSATVVELLPEEILEEKTINDLADSLFAVVQDSAPVQMVLDFSPVKHLSSSTLGTLIRLKKRIEETGGGLLLCSIREPLQEIFKITKLDRIFDIYPDRDQALSSLKAS